MIQRIQSLYFFLTTLLVVLFLPGTDLSFINNTGAAVIVCFGGICNTANGAGSMAEKLYIFPAFIIAIALLSLVAISLFKKRELQLLLSRILTGIIALFGIYTAWLVTSVMSRYEAHFIPGFKPFLIVLMLVFSILASRGIKKDIDLVKSYDRLR
jgi:hypothetical protein